MDFLTSNEIQLRPGDVDYGVEFEFPVTTSGVPNSGTIPYGVSISSVTVTGYYGDSAASDLISGSPSVTGDDIVNVNLNYPSTTLSGVTRVSNLGLKFILVLDNGTEADLRYDNIIARP